MRIEPAAEIVPDCCFSDYLSHSVSLSKVHLSIFIGFSALFGSFLFNPAPGVTSWCIAVSVFFLSCGSSTLNNIQDRDIDGRFKRTCNRPLPKNSVPIRFAVTQCLMLLVVSGVMLLVCSETFTPIFLGIISIVLYNGLYTPLKRKTLFALVPGVLCGMLPPLIGWSASGGKVLSVDIITVMVMFGMWQVPHTWIVILRHFSDYSGKLFPGFAEYFNSRSLRRLVFVWISGFAVIMILFASGMAVINDLTRWIIIANAICLVWKAGAGMMFSHKADYLKLFLHLNFSLMVVMVLVVTERCLLFG